MISFNLKVKVSYKEEINKTHLLANLLDIKAVNKTGFARQTMLKHCEAVIQVLPKILNRTIYMT